MILFVDDNSGILFIKNIVVDTIKKTAVFASKIIKTIVGVSKIWIQ